MGNLQTRYPAVLGSYIRGQAIDKKKSYFSTSYIDYDFGVYNSFAFTEKVENTIEVILEKLSEYHII